VPLLRIPRQALRVQACGAGRGLLSLPMHLSVRRPSRGLSCPRGAGPLVQGLPRIWRVSTFQVLPRIWRVSTFQVLPRIWRVSTFQVLPRIWSPAPYAQGLALLSLFGLELLPDVRNRACLAELTRPLLAEAARGCSRLARQQGQNVRSFRDGESPVQR